MGAKKRRIARGGRPEFEGETAKARGRREREGFFERYCQGRGLDIGHGGDKVTTQCEGWDVEQGDAAELAGVPPDSFDFVYSSHLLEHFDDPAGPLRAWFRAVRPGGYLILYVPERDLYEKRTRLPSRFNPDHRSFFLLDRDDPPDTVGLLPLLTRALADSEIVYAKVCSEGNTVRDPKLHSDGEYSIEVVVRKVAG